MLGKEPSGPLGTSPGQVDAWKHSQSPWKRVSIPGGPLAHFLGDEPGCGANLAFRKVSGRGGVQRQRSEA